RALLLERLKLLQSCGESKRVPPIEVLDEIREAAQVKGGGTKNAWSDEGTYEDVKSALAQLRGEIDEISHFSEVDRVGIARAGELSAAAVNVVRAAAEDLASAKREAGLLGFDDLLVQTRNVLRDSPSARGETAGSIAALLVDEFQDTD